MWRQGRTTNRAKCVLLSAFVILCAINHEVNCGRYLGRIGGKIPRGRPRAVEIPTYHYQPSPSYSPSSHIAYEPRGPVYMPSVSTLTEAESLDVLKRSQASFSAMRQLNMKRLAASEYGLDESSIESTVGGSRGVSRSWGGSRTVSRPTYHPSPSSHSTYHRPSPSPSPSPGSYRPIGFDTSRPAGQGHVNLPSVSRPIGFEHLGSPNHGAIGPPVRSTNNYATNSQPHSSSGSISKASAPPLEHSNNKPPSYGFKDPVGPPKDVTPVSNTPYGGATNAKASAPPAEHITHNRPQGSANTGSAKPPPYGFKNPVGPPTNVKPVNNPPPGAPFPIHPPPYTPHSPGIPPPAYNPAHNPAGYGPPPAYSPSYNPAGYGHPPAYRSGAYPQQQYHPGGYWHPNYPHAGQPGVTINNIVTNNHIGGGGYGGGFGYSPPTYHYSSSNVGSGALGFFLGYSLAKMTTPTFHYNPGFYNGYTPRYDHYEVHHYYHNRDSVPAQSTIQPNAIVGCIGDSGTICPSGTTSLCTNNGAILCVASATSTVPCTDGKQGNCVKTVVPCVNGTGDCEVGKNTTITIPCISTAKVPGNITYINNTIIVNQTTIINNNYTTGNGTVTSINGTVTSTNNTMLSTPLTNHTTDTPTTLQPPAESIRNKRETPAEVVHNFCVTILALPAERKPTEQEQMVKRGTSIFSKFLVRALGIQ